MCGMKWISAFAALILLVFAGCGVQPPGPGAEATPLPDLGEAPDLIGDTWLNSAAPLRPEELHGRVVLVDMWTFG